MQNGVDHYVKRLQPYSRVEIIELPEAKTGGSAGVLKALEDEGREILRHTREGAHMIVLDAAGQEMTTGQLASHLENLQLQGSTKVDFIIGGPEGLADEVKKKGTRLSLSRLTFPHRLARLILLEQLYRCFKIIRGEPYHR